MKAMSNEFVGSELVKLPVAAKFLQLSERNVGQKARDGQIPSVKIGGSRRFSMKALNQWLERKICDGDSRK
jgi:excisionase family DNA binding protein